MLDLRDERGGLKPKHLVAIAAALIAIFVSSDYLSAVSQNAKVKANVGDVALYSKGMPDERLREKIYEAIRASGIDGVSADDISITREWSGDKLDIRFSYSRQINMRFKWITKVYDVNVFQGLPLPTQ